MRFFIIITSLFITTTILAQNDIAIGQWRTHFPVSKMISVTQSSEKVYYASEQMVLIYDKAEASIERLDKVSGLTQVGIKVIRYNADLDLLLIAYLDGNLDVVKDGQVINISDIKRYSLISDKEPFHIHYNGNFAYISYTFGLVELDLLKYEVKNSYLTENFDVKASYVWNDTIFISTEEGIYQGNPDLNLGDFSSWIAHRSNKGLPNNYFSIVMEFFNGHLIAGVNDTLKIYDGFQWNDFQSINQRTGDTASFHLRPNENWHLSVSTSGQELLQTTGLEVIIMQLDGRFYPHSTSNDLRNPRQAIKQGSGIYYADLSKGARMFLGADRLQVTANAPLTKNMSKIAIKNNEVWIGAGGVNGSWQALNRSEGVMILKDGIWSFINKSNTDSLEAFTDVVPVAIHPSNGKVYLGSYRRGLGQVEIDAEAAKVYSTSESTLASPPLDPTSVRVTGLAFDDDKNLWMSNYEAPNPISVLRSDGTWESYPLPAASSQIAEMAVDRSGNKWAVVARGSGGVAVFNENEAVVGGSDNRFRILTTGNSQLPSNSVNCLVVDRDGDIWVGTLEGTVVFECASQMFTADGCQGRKVIVEEDDFGEYLLKTENVTSIAVDGADRKWFGTENGIFVQSADGEETIHHFTAENSPLPSNTIIDIEINPINGEVFIATDEGLISYRSDATTGSNTHSTNAYAYPNPVRPNYTGPIAIKGLVNDANVKITDISGALVYETTALGGQAVWNGRDYNGRKAASGVYLIFSSNRDGLQTLVTKVVVMN